MSAKKTENHTYQQKPERFLKFTQNTSLKEVSTTLSTNCSRSDIISTLCSRNTNTSYREIQRKYTLSLKFSGTNRTKHRTLSLSQNENHQLSTNTTRIHYLSPKAKFLRYQQSHELITTKYFDGATQIPISTVSDSKNYVLSLTQQEQLMASAFNFLQIQCWAYSLRHFRTVNPVEPQVLRGQSILGFSFSAENDSPIVTSDVFDMNSWYSQWPEGGPNVSPLIPRSDFIDDIQKMPMNVIIVQMNFQFNAHHECPFTWDTSSLIKELRNYPLLKVIKKVCICASRSISVDVFNDIIFKNTRPKHNIIIFTDWKGIGSDRANIISTPCLQRVPPYTTLKPSSKVMRDAEEFANKYLGGFGQYISISARFEKLVRNYRRLSLEKKKAIVASSINDTLAKLIHLKYLTRLDHVYLAYDYGQFGSESFKQRLYYNSSDRLVKFVNDVYDGRLSYSEYQLSLLNFKSQNPGYIAMVQMTLASRGRCLIHVGWGHCIDFVKALYKSFHTEDNLCLKCVPLSLCSGQ